MQLLKKHNLCHIRKKNNFEHNNAQSRACWKNTPESLIWSKLTFCAMTTIILLPKLKISFSDKNTFLRKINFLNFWFSFYWYFKIPKISLNMIQRGLLSPAELQLDGCIDKSRLETQHGENCSFICWTAIWFESAQVCKLAF